MTDERHEHRWQRDDPDSHDAELPAAGTPEFVEIQRLDESLSLLRAGQPPRIDRLEDPEVASLLDVAAFVERPLRESTDVRPFRSFRTRSRAAILHELEQDRRAAAEAQGGIAGVILPFLRRPVFAPVAAAAAAATLVIAVLASGVLELPGQGGDPSAVSNLTQETTIDELTRISVALATIQERTERGEVVPAPLLREVTESAARVANMIERNPESLDREAVETYGQAMRTGSAVLETARTDADAEGALASAQRATRDGDVVAAGYLSADEEIVEPDPTAEPEPTDTPTPAPTETPTPSPTPDATDQDGDDADDTDSDDTDSGGTEGTDEAGEDPDGETAETP